MLLVLQIFTRGDTLVTWAFAYVYVTRQALDPNSLAGGQPRSWIEMLFPSFTILTGTGMSDILPSTGHAMSVVMVERAVGLFYVAMVVTRLVGLQAMPRRA